MGRPRVPLVDRFASRVAATPTTTGCLEWKGTLAADGYGVIGKGGDNKIAGPAARAHRVAWELVHGPIPEDLCVCHHCDNRRCVNISHLFLGTVADNNADRSRKGRTTRASHPKPRGELSPTSKLSDDERGAIRALARSGAFTQKKIGGWFGVSPQLVSILKRQGQ